MIVRDFRTGRPGHHVNDPDVHRQIRAGFGEHSAATPRRTAMSITQATRISKPVTVTINGAQIHATLSSPPDARGVVILVHASDSNRNSPGTTQLASILNDASLATLAC